MSIINFLLFLKKEFLKMDERVGGGEEVAGTACLVDVVAWLLYFTCLVCDLMWLSQILHILK